MNATRTRPEVLAPAGTEEMMRAAIENGADAIYFGLQTMNARIRAANFDSADLPRIMANLHERAVRGYVTLNTLVFNGELEEAAQALRACSDSGVDAVLVQDLGLAWLANTMTPSLPVHASTQMTLTAAESIAGAERLGLRLERVVAARETSRKELRKMTAATAHEIEVFVHGALCVAYSGQCLTSEALGGRSANRGECAQACRLPYDLVVDGQTRDLGDVRYLLSPKDLAAIEDIGDLMEIGIASLKIEGRLKTPQYVAATVQSYRAAIDSVLAGERPTLAGATRRKLEQTFSRGFTGGYLHETNHQVVVEGRFPKKRGLYLGRVARATHEGVVVNLEGPLKAGDGVVFDAGRPEEDEQGGRVYELFRGGRSIGSFDPEAEGEESAAVLLTFGGGRIDHRQLSPGDRVWKTSDPALDAALTASYTGERPKFQRPVRAEVWARPGEPMRLVFIDEDGLRGEATDSEPAQKALKQPLTVERLQEQLGRLGNTPVYLAELRADIADDPMVPLSRLNELRRRALAALLDARRRRNAGRPFVADAMTTLRAETRYLEAPRDGEVPPAPELSVLCRTLEQVEAIVAQGTPRTLYTDFEDIRLHREARSRIPRGGGWQFVPATLRIVKPGEAPFIRRLLEAEPDAALVRGLAAWQILQTEAPDLPVRGDYSLNVANDLTARLLRRAGFGILTPSYDLNMDQLGALLRAAPPHWFEVTIHQYMPMFHMEHCVFCRFLSEGTDFTNCGRPCETHKLSLRDRVGFEHPVKADAGCRNTVFNATAQSASEYLATMLAAGVRRYRIDLLQENAAQTVEAVAAYTEALRGGTGAGHDLWRRLRAKSKLGVTKGSLDYE